MGAPLFAGALSRTGRAHGGRVVPRLSSLGGRRRTLPRPPVGSHVFAAAHPGRLFRPRARRGAGHGRGGPARMARLSLLWSYPEHRSLLGGSLSRTLAGLCSAACAVAAVARRYPEWGARVRTVPHPAWTGVF